MLLPTESIPLVFVPAKPREQSSVRVFPQQHSEIGSMRSMLGSNKRKKVLLPNVVNQTLRPRNASLEAGSDSGENSVKLNYPTFAVLCFIVIGFM